MLKLAYALGVRSAFQKFALEPPSPADAFVADVEEAKGAPPIEAEAPSSVLLPGDPKGGLGALTSKIAIGLKDMLFFEQQLGKDEAHKLFSDLQNQIQGKPGFATRGTLNISPQGVQLQPFEHPLPPVPQRPVPVIPPMHPRAGITPQAITSAAPRAMPPPLPTVLRR